MIVWYLFIAISGHLEVIDKPYPTERACVLAAEAKWSQSTLQRLPVRGEDYTCIARKEQHARS